MKRLGIALIVFGVCLEVLAIFGNRAPYPLVLKLASPEYAAAREAYRSFTRDGIIEEGDEGFDALRLAYMDLTLTMPDPPFPLDEIEGVTVTRFYADVLENSSELEESSVVVAEYSNGDTEILSGDSLVNLTGLLLKREAALINAGLLVLGCALVYYGLRVIFLDVKDAGEATEPSEKRLAGSGAA